MYNFVICFFKLTHFAIYLVFCVTFCCFTAVWCNISFYVEWSVKLLSFVWFLWSLRLGWSHWFYYLKQGKLIFFWHFSSQCCIFPNLSWFLSPVGQTQDVPLAAAIVVALKCFIKQCKWALQSQVFYAAGRKKCPTEISAAQLTQCDRPTESTRPPPSPHHADLPHNNHQSRS